jgi:hypothetical protein
VVLAERPNGELALGVGDPERRPSFLRHAGSLPPSGAPRNDAVSIPRQ